VRVGTGQGKMAVTVAVVVVCVGTWESLLVEP
jgi:hypothetical protein